MYTMITMKHSIFTKQFAVFVIINVLIHPIYATKSDNDRIR